MRPDPSGKVARGLALVAVATVVVIAMDPTPMGWLRIAAAGVLGLTAGTSGWLCGRESSAVRRDQLSYAQLHEQAAVQAAEETLDNVQGRIDQMRRAIARAATNRPKPRHLKGLP